MADRDFGSSLIVEIIVNTIFALFLVPLWRRVYRYFAQKHTSEGFLSRGEGVAPSHLEKQNLDDLCED